MEPHRHEPYDTAGTESDGPIEQADEKRWRQLSLASGPDVAIRRTDIEDELDAGIGGDRFVAVVRRVLFLEDPQAPDAVLQHCVRGVLAVPHAASPDVRGWYNLRFRS